MPRDPPVELFQFVEERVVVETRILAVLQERDDLWMWPDRVGHIQQRQAHLCRHVVRNRLRQNIGHVLFTQPVEELIVQPVGGVHSGHEHLVAARVEQHSPQLPRYRPG